MKTTRYCTGGQESGRYHTEPRITRRQPEDPMTEITTEDRDGWPIRVGTRVYVRPRPSTIVPGHQLPAIRGYVTGISESGEAIDIREDGTQHLRTVLARYARVKGDPEAVKRRHHAAAEADKPKRQTRQVRRGKVG